MKGKEERETRRCVLGQSAAQHAMQTREAAKPGGLSSPREMQGTDSKREGSKKAPCWDVAFLCAGRNGVIDQPTRIRERDTEGRAQPAICMRYLVDSIFDALAGTEPKHQYHI